MDVRVKLTPEVPPLCWRMRLTVGEDPRDPNAYLQLIDDDGELRAIAPLHIDEIEGIIGQFAYLHQAMKQRRAVEGIVDDELDEDIDEDEIPDGTPLN